MGGVKRIAKASEYIVVVLAVLYIGVAAFIVLVNITELPAMIALIVKKCLRHRTGRWRYTGCRADERREAWIILE